VNDCSESLDGLFGFLSFLGCHFCGFLGLFGFLVGLTGCLGSFLSLSLGGFCGLSGFLSLFLSGFYCLFDLGLSLGCRDGVFKLLLTKLADPFEAKLSGSLAEFFYCWAHVMCPIP